MRYTNIVIVYIYRSVKNDEKRDCNGIIQSQTGRGRERVFIKKGGEGVLGAERAQ